MKEDNQKKVISEELREEIIAAFEADKKNSIERLAKRHYETEKKTRTVAQNIKHYRKVNDLSQEKLAEMMSCDRGTIINWENGTHIPNALQIEDLARIFGIEVGELHTKQVWDINQGSNERKQIAKYEQEWLENHPVTITKAEEGSNRFNCFDFYRDYCWIGKDGFFVVALELLNRGYKVTRFDGCYMNDMNQTLYEGEFGAEMMVDINKEQLRTFGDAVSEILVDYASNTSRFDNVIDLRKRYIEKFYARQGHMQDFIEEYIRGLVKEGKYNEIFVSANIQEDGEDLLFVGTMESLFEKLRKLGFPKEYSIDEILSSGGIGWVSRAFGDENEGNNN